MSKKLNAKSLRQGQTVYFVVLGGGKRYIIVIKFLENEYLATNAATANRLGSKATYSRRKATRKAKELNRMMKDNARIIIGSNERTTRAKDLCWWSNYEG